MDDHYPFCGASGLDWQLCRGDEITGAGYLTSLPFVVWRAPEFLVERAEEWGAERETVMVKFEVKDVEFEEDHVEVVRLAVNPP